MEIDYFFPLLSFFFVSRNLFNKSTNRVRFSTIAVSNNSDFSPSLPPSQLRQIIRVRLLFCLCISLLPSFRRSEQRTRGGNRQWVASVSWRGRLRWMQPSARGIIIRVALVHRTAGEVEGNYANWSSRLFLEAPSSPPTLLLDSRFGREISSSRKLVKDSKTVMLFLQFFFCISEY